MYAYYILVYHMYIYLYFIHFKIKKIKDYIRRQFFYAIGVNMSFVGTITNLLSTLRFVVSNSNEKLMHDRHIVKFCNTNVKDPYN